MTDGKQMTTTYSSRYERWPLLPKAHAHYYPSSKFSPKLFHGLENADMNKESFVRLERVYEVSLPMLKKDDDEPSLGYNRLSHPSLARVRKKIKPDMDQLEFASHAIKLCPRSSSTSSDDLQFPLPNSDTKSGGTTGTTPVVSKPQPLASSTQSSAPTSSASSELTDHSASASDTSSSTSRSVAVSTGGEVNHKLTFPSTSRGEEVRKPNQMEPVATKPVGETAVKVSSSVGSPPNQPAATNPNMDSKSTVVPTLDSAPTSAMAERVESATVVEGSKRPEFCETGKWNFIKPGAILWNQPGEYRPNFDPARHTKDKTDRPCVVLHVCEVTATVQVLNVSRFSFLSIDC